MANKTRFSIAKPDIIEYFDDYGKTVFSKEDISHILSQNRRFWRLTYNLTIERFIELLLEKTKLKRHQLKFNTGVFIRYSWGEVDNIDIILSLRSRGYLSHYSAVSYHGLTEQLPKTIYFNVEQGRKSPKSGKLNQSQIDTALSRDARLSKNYTVFRDQKVYLLNGKYTGQLGVETNEETEIRVTNIERTLIDITVRPEYSGGVFEVLKAFVSASDKLSVNKLASFLKKIDYIYPYHQCIGFYMMISGKYRESQLDLIRKIESPYKFYLTHGIKERKFSKEWNLYYPATLSF